MTNLNNKIVDATKWSAITEILAKVASPITTMVLVRLLTPEAFGVVATITMIVSFAELFTDAGFQKYIVQHDFKNQQEQDASISVAFTYNLTLSIIIWVLIFIFNRSLAHVLGTPGLGHVIVVACLSIPLASFSSIQAALFKRNFDFKTLFYVRIACAFLPFLVTIPLAYIYRNYWALVIGTLVGNFVQAAILTVKSPWKLSLSFDLDRLRAMISFCGWTLLDSMLSWCTWYMDVFFIGMFLNEYYLGLYKTSMSLVSNIMNLAYSSFFPVLIPALSRLQNDLPSLKNTLLKFQKISCIVILPLGFMIFSYNDLVTNLILGSQWSEAAGFVGLWAIVDVFVVLFTRFTGSAFVAIGKPKISVLDNVLHLIVLIPAVFIAAHYDFHTLYITRSLVRIEGVAVAFVLTYYTLKLTPWAMIKNILPEILSGMSILVISCICLYFSLPDKYVILVAMLSIVIYLGLLSLYKTDRELLGSLYAYIKRQFLNRKKDVTIQVGEN